MSASAYVRTTVKQWAASSATPTVPFIDTNNIAVDPQSTHWFTADWVYADTAAETYCRTTLTEGEFSLVFFGPAGVGEDALLALAEPVVVAFMKNTDPGGRLTLLESQAADDYLPANPRWFSVRFDIGYEFRSP